MTLVDDIKEAIQEEVPSIDDIKEAIQEVLPSIDDIKEAIQEDTINGITETVDDLERRLIKLTKIVERIAERLDVDQ
jgi:methyl-accepting chemotaxis protein